MSDATPPGPGNPLDLLREDHRLILDALEATTSRRSISTRRWSGAGCRPKAAR